MGSGHIQWRPIFGIFTGLLVIIVAVIDIKEEAKTVIDDAVNDRSASSRLNLLPLRNLASSYRGQYLVEYFPYNKINTTKINGEWTVVNFIDSDGIDHKMNVGVNLDLIGNSLVMIDQDPKQVFRISLFTGTTLALVKKISDNFEILELRRLDQPKLVSNKVKKISIQKAETGASVSKAIGLPEAGVRYTGIIDSVHSYFVLERAFNPNISKNIFLGEFVTGSMSVFDGSITALEVTIAVGLDFQQSISIERADVKDGGIFETVVNGETVSGIISNNGEHAYRLRFASGPMKGAMLNFVTEEELENIIEKQKDTPSQENSHEGRGLEVGSVEAEQRSYELERQNVAYAAIHSSGVDDIQNEGGQDVTPSELSERLNSSGFEFSKVDQIID